VRKQTPLAVWVGASAVLLVVAIVLFAILHRQRRDEKVEEVIQEITTKREEPAVPATDRAAVVSEIVQDSVRQVEDKEAAEAEAAERLAKERKKRERFETRPLPHLDSTPEELRTEIDELIAKATNLSLTVEADKACERLIEIRKPAIPRLLNRFVGLDMTNPDHIQIANIVHRTLLRMTGYDKIVFSPMQPEDDLQSRFRIAAIRFWFQWWGENEATFE